MDWSIVQQYLPFYQKAFFLTLHIAVLGILGSFLLGLVVSVIRHYRVPILSQLSTAYIELSRNTPLLIQLFFLYFGLPRIGLVLSSEACAVVGLIFLGGSYMAESFRSGLEAVSQTQHEVGLSIGLTPFQVFRYVVLPQAVAVALPSFSANVSILSGSLGGFDVCGQGFDWSLLRNRCGSRHVGGGLSLDVAADFSSL